MKLGLMKLYVKELPTEGLRFKYLIYVFRDRSKESIKASEFNGPQLQQLVKDKYLIGTMSELKKIAWLLFKDLFKNFLGNNDTKILMKLLESYRRIGCKININLNLGESKANDSTYS